MNQKHILYGLSMLMLASLVALCTVTIIKNPNKLQPAGLLNSIENIFKGDSSKSKTAERIGSGKVVSINGDTITVMGSITTTYKINVSDAKLTKNSGSDAKDISASDIKAGDIIRISGTIADNPVSVASVVDSGAATMNPFSLNGLGNLANIHPASSTSSNNNPSSSSLKSMSDFNNILKSIKTK